MGKVSSKMDMAKAGKDSAGKREMIMHLESRELTLAQAVRAKCYDCCCGYVDGKVDCGSFTCSLHPFMAYNKNARKSKKGSAYTDEQKAAARERMAFARKIKGGMHE
jgi:hypothetical protein